jgi:hypothetical protein
MYPIIIWFSSGFRPAYVRPTPWQRSLSDKGTAQGRCSEAAIAAAGLNATVLELVRRRDWGCRCSCRCRSFDCDCDCDCDGLLPMVGGQHYPCSGRLRPAKTRPEAG